MARLTSLDVKKTSHSLWQMQTLAPKAPVPRGRRIWLRRCAFVGLSLLIGLKSGISEGHSLEPPSVCLTNAQRVQFSNLVFCWPVAPDAPEFKFEILDQMVGSQWFVEGRRATAEELRAFSASGSFEKPHVLAIFGIASFDNPVLQTFGTSAGLERVREAIELRKNEPVAIVLNEGERLGVHTFEFRKVAPALFAASKLLLPKEGSPVRVEYWAAMTSDGKVDYVMHCGILDRIRNCSSQFSLSANLVRIAISMSKNADSARRAFEELRRQIRSYVLWPELAR